MPTISIPDDTYKRLADRAAAIGATVEQFVVPLLDQAVPSEPDQRERQRAFEDLTNLIRSYAAQYPPEHVLDTSREAIYEDRLRSQL